MNILSIFNGALGWITLIWLAIIVIVFIVAVCRLVVKSGRIIKDCNATPLPGSDEDLEKTKVGKLILENIVHEADATPEDALNASCVSAAYKLNLRLAQATPSILTSLGILGTFIGLAYAVLQFDSTSSESIRDSINSLLSGMGTAFFTSVFGMLFSVIFLWAERKRYNTLCNTVESLCDRAGRCFRRSTDQIIGDRLLEISEKVTGIESSFGDNLDKVFDEKVTPVMTDISKKLENPAQTVVDSLIMEFRKITNGLATTLTEKLNDKMSELIDQFILASDSMKEIPGTIDTATNNLLQSSEQAISTQKTFTEETQKRIETLAGELTESVKNQMSAINKKFENAASALNELPDIISGSVEAQKGVTTEFANQVENLKTIEEVYSAAIKSITDANNDLADAKSNIATLTSKISTAAEPIQNASSGMVKSNEKMVADFEYIYELNKEVTNQVKDYSERIQGIEGGLKGVFAEIEKGLTRYASTSSKNMQGLLDVFTTSVTDACQNISNATAPLHETIGGILKALDKTEKSAESLLKRVENLPQQKDQLNEA